MPSAREIKNRIRSIKNIGQITRALEAEAASKVRRAQARVLASRAYAEKAWEILLNVQATAAKGTPLHPLLTARSQIKQVLVVLVTSDRGLAGAFNSNIIRAAVRFADRLGKPIRWVAVGKKARDTLVRGGYNMIAEFSNKANPSAAGVHPIAQLAINEFLSGTVDEVFVAYTDFINTLTQRPTVLPMLPLLPFETSDEMIADYLKKTPQVSGGKMDYEYEPSPSAILDEIVPRFTELQLYHALLESQASEQSARMVAMRNASDNAKGLQGELTLQYNKARQAGITAEILDIVGGAEALQATLEQTDKSAKASVATPHVEAAIASRGNGHATSKAAATIAPAAPSAPAATTSAVSAPAPKKGGAKGDDLTTIEGIGPKISKALIAAGIDTFQKLSEADEDALRAALTAAEMSFAPSLNTWAEQAGYAARGDWDGLKKLQDTLDGGRRIN
jgi:F-type H+-transporting ATPase subunit gamma